MKAFSSDQVDELNNRALSNLFELLALANERHLMNNKKQQILKKWGPAINRQQLENELTYVMFIK